MQRVADKQDTRHPWIHGTCSAEFGSLKDTFAQNFAERGEVGASVCVYKEGERVVHLWAGYCDAARTRPWREDTLVCMMSVGKSMAALCAMMLLDRGVLELSERVASYWPEFGEAGKDKLTVEQMLGGFAGVLYLDAAPPGCILDWNQMVRAIEKQRPVFPVGSQGAYHSMTYGYMVGELVNRVDPRGFAGFFREEVTTPLDADYHFGLADEDLARVADLIPNPDSATLTAMTMPDTNIGRAWRLMPDTPDFFNSLSFRKAVFASANGHGNAGAVARIYAALAEGGELDGVRLCSRDVIEKARSVQWDGVCGLTGHEFKYGLGFFLNKPPLESIGANPRNFGHGGAGGAIGVADMESHLAFSYSPNYMCGGAGMGPRSDALLHAALG